MILDDEIEILDYEQDENINLISESSKRKKILKLAQKEIEKQSLNMIEYYGLPNKLKKVNHDYKKLETENRILRYKVEQMEEENRKKEAELVKLRLASEQNKKKRNSLQAMLQVIINNYGINEIIEILGISYIKLKEYLHE
jgi:predicted RNase H-like nuclease (RuvC/YqgF family)